jgi:predicted RNase H-like nuclease (RuvC/YqgF family)
MAELTKEQQQGLRKRTDEFGAKRSSIIAGLLDTIDSRDAEIEALRAQVAEWKKAVEGLTPSGSEFVNDPKACAAYIRKRTEYPRIIIELRAELADLRGRMEALAKHCIEASEYSAVTGVWREGDPESVVDVAERILVALAAPAGKGGSDGR